MFTKEEREQIIKLVKKEVVPAIGCTEPMAVALCVAKASELLTNKPTHIKALLSSNILKNAMGVGIPGTGGMIGLPIAIALGMLVGKSEYQLQVLKDCTPKDVEKGKELINSHIIDIQLKEDITEKLYIEVIAENEKEKSIAIISGSHTNFIYIEHNGEVLLNKSNASHEDEAESAPQLTLRKVYDFAMTAPLDEIEFIEQSGSMNMSAAKESLNGNYGHALGKTLCGKSEKQMMGDSTFSHILSYTSAACDARMAGSMIPVMSNSGSGNQGIAASLPVWVYAKENGKSHEQLIRALMLSNLTPIYIKQSLGKLSALCGCVVAGTGSSCGITYLMGGGYNEVSSAVKNMIANLTGMICDGAKPSCTLKLSSGISTAVLSAMLAMEGKCVTSVEGIIDDDVDKSIHNLTQIGAEGMNETDKLILSIMTNK